MIGLRELDLTPEGARLLWRLTMFCAEWQGKVIEYVNGPTSHMPGSVERGVVLGHDGPVYSEERQSWVLAESTTFLNRFGGWGVVEIMRTPGIYHHTDPMNIAEVREIRRDIPEYTVYDYEAVDLYCPHGCDADGMREWHIDWDGPEYEAFCPIHRAVARNHASALYHSPKFQTPEGEAAYFEAIRGVYARAEPLTT